VIIISSFLQHRLNEIPLTGSADDCLAYPHLDSQLRCSRKISAVVSHNTCRAWIQANADYMSGAAFIIMEKSTRLEDGSAQTVLGIFKRFHGLVQSG